MKAGNAEEFNLGERVYVGKTTRDATVREHIARYEFADELIGEGRIVVDAACGSGYGSQMLAGHARHVVGFDVSESAVNYAAKHHASSKLSYVRADLDWGLPIRSGTIDDLVSFETIEHVSGPERLVSEFSRVLRQGGRLILSTPDRLVYSDLDGYSNPFHRAEVSRRELVDLVSTHFNIETMYGQVRWIGSPSRSRIKRAVKRRLPSGILGVVKAATARRGSVVSPPATVESDVSLQPIDVEGVELYFFIVIVARKR